MLLLNWIGANWFAVIQSGGIVGGLIYTGSALRTDAKARQVANHFTLTKQHREIWSLLFERPELARILDPKADLGKAPVTLEEDMFVRFLIFHLNDSYRASSADFFLYPENLAADIRTFFALPIPKAVWRRAAGLQDREFAAFVERAMQSAGV